MVQIAIAGRLQLQTLLAQVKECFVVYRIDLVGIFYQLVHGEHGVVWLGHCVRYLDLKSIQS